MYGIKSLYDNILQIIIDGCKREYEINGMDEIDRIQKMPCMKMTKTICVNDDKEKEIKCDYPKFMKYTKDIQYTKDGVEIPFEIVRANKKKIYDRINYDLECPMNWLEEILDEIIYGTKYIENFSEYSESNTELMVTDYIDTMGEINSKINGLSREAGLEIN